MNGSTLIRIDPDGLRYVTTILVWAHWFVVAFNLVQLAYRPAGWPEGCAVYAELFLVQGRGHVNLAQREKEILVSFCRGMSHVAIAAARESR